MAHILVDSDVVIDRLRGHPGAEGALRVVASDDTICCCAVTVAEVRAGMRPDEEEATLLLFDAMEVLPVDREVALLAGRLKCEAKGFRLELADCLIAACAMRIGARLLTRNPRHYPHTELEVVPAEYR